MQRVNSGIRLGSLDCTRSINASLERWQVLPGRVPGQTAAPQFARDLVL